MGAELMVVRERAAKQTPQVEVVYKMWWVVRANADAGGGRTLRLGVPRAGDVVGRGGKLSFFVFLTPCMSELERRPV